MKRRTFIGLGIAVATTSLAISQAPAAQPHAEFLGNWGPAHMNLPGVGQQDVSFDVQSVTHAGVTGTMTVVNKFGDGRSTVIPLTEKNTKFSGDTLVFTLGSGSHYDLHRSGSRVAGTFTWSRTWKAYDVDLPHTG